MDEPDTDSGGEMAKKSKKAAVEINPERGSALVELRARLGESQDIFGERFRVTQATVSRWEQGWPPARKHVGKLIQLGVSKNFFLPADAKDGSSPPVLDRVAGNFLPDREANQILQQSGTQRVSVRGRVGGGQWMDAAEYDLAPDEHVDVPVDLRFPNARYTAFHVERDSMNEVGIHDGFYITCLEYTHAGAISLQTGMIVVIEERRDGGNLIRRRLKEVNILRDRYELRPRSTDPRYKPIELPINYFDEPHDELAIIGIVIGAFKRFDPFQTSR